MGMVDGRRDRSWGWLMVEGIIDQLIAVEYLAVAVAVAVALAVAA